MGRVRAIHVRNYRSCGDWVDIEFPRHGPLVLVGPNNAGKSNIVRALELVLGERWPGTHEPDDHEFHGRSREAIPMEIILDVDNITASYRAETFAVAQIQWRLPPADPDEDHRPVAFNLIGPDGSVRWANNDARQQCYCMVIGADRRLNYQLSYTSRFTLLSRLMRRFHEHLVNDEERVERLQTLFSEVVSTFYEVDEFRQFADDLRRNANELGASLEYGLELDFSAYDPSNFFHSLRVRPQTSGFVRNFDELGTGQEQILAIAFAYAYAQAFGAGAAEGLLLVIEEPEAHLHPLAQRWLGRKVHELAAEGIQVVVTTHSPAFLDLEAVDGLVLVRKTSEAASTTVTQWTRQSLAAYCIEHGSNPAKTTASRVGAFYAASATEEILAGIFARSCVLVEGATEQLALPPLLRAVGLDPEAEGVAVLPVGGIGSLARWWRFFTAFGIGAYVVFDRDSPDDVAGNHRADLFTTLGVNEAIASDLSTSPSGLLVEPRFAVMISDFEHAVQSLFPSQYDAIQERATERVGGSKPLQARYMCERLDRQQDSSGWQLIADLAAAIQATTDTGGSAQLENNEPVHGDSNLS